MTPETKAIVKRLLIAIVAALAAAAVDAINLLNLGVV